MDLSSLLIFHPFNIFFFFFLYQLFHPSSTPPFPPCKVSTHLYSYFSTSSTIPIYYVLRKLKKKRKEKKKLKGFTFGQTLPHQIKSIRWLMKGGKWLAPPTPRKSLVCPHALSSFCTCRRFVGGICDKSPE